MTGYFPHDNARYGGFLNKKKENQFMNKAQIDRDFKPKEE